MSEINTIHLLNQIRTMATQAEGSRIESSENQVSFGAVLQQTLNHVNDLTQSSDALKARFEMGDPNVSLGEVMIAGQKSNLGFEATLRVRNKLVQAYQDIMNMPV